MILGVLKAASWTEIPEHHAHIAAFVCLFLGRHGSRLQMTASGRMPFPGCNGERRTLE
jgi:hypothetical protein